jgi:tetratricopeptide (TPR) repeat protein
MHHVISSTRRRLTGIAILGLSFALLSGCSRAGRAARLLAQADRDFTGGEFDKAEIEYKNVLQKDPQNPTAIAQLGVLYYDEGRYGRATAYLSRAKQLQPDNLTVRGKLGLILLAARSTNEARDEAIYILEHRPSDDLAPLLLVEASTTPQDLENARQRLLALPAPAAKSATVLTALGNIALRQNRAKEAETAFNAALATDPKSVAAYGSLGVLRWAQRDLAGADVAFKQAADLSPVRSPKRLHYAQFKVQINDLAAARQILEEITRKTPEYLPGWIWLADVAVKENKLDEADTCLAKALAREPQDPEALLLNARVRIAKGEAEKAIADLEPMLTTYPRAPQVAYQLALAYAATGDTTKALARVAQVIAAAPDMVQAVLTQGELQLRQHDFTAAIATLKLLAQQRPELLTARVFLAEAYRGQGSLEEAAAVYAALKKERPQDPTIVFAHATVLLQQNKLAEARVGFATVCELQPGNVPALEQLVELDLREKRPADARKRLDVELAKEPKSAPLNLLFAKTCLAAGDISAAETALKNTIEQQPNSAAAHYMLTQLYAKSNQQEKAIAGLKETVQQNPQSLAPVLLLGILLDERGDRAGARDAYEKALVLNPKSSLAVNNLAYLYSEHFEQFDRALELAKRARALLPQDARTADTLGWVLVKKGQYVQGIPLLQECTAKLPDEPEVQYHLGVAHYMLGNEPAALGEFEHALELGSAFPHADDARARLAILKLSPAQVGPEARGALEKRLATTPDDPVALFRLGEIARRGGDMDKALTLYSTVLKTNPKHAGALIGQARVYTAKRDLPKALEAAKTARTSAPNDPEITHTVGRLAYESGDHRWAASLLQDAAKTRADNAEVLFDWAEAAYSVGRVSDAESSMRHALEVAPKFSRSGAAQRFLDMLSLCANPAAAKAGDVDQVLKTDPANAPALMATALIAEQKADAQTARKQYETLLNHFPEFSPAQRNLTILYAAGPADTQMAANLANKARQAFPNDAVLARAAGIIAYRQGEFNKALNLLQDVVTKNTTDGEALYYLGMAQWRLNKRSEGKQSLQRALELGLKDTLAAEAKKNLESS